MSTHHTKENVSKKRPALLKAGLALMMKHGIERISVEDICREACVSKMTFYKYFANKPALIGAILEDQFRTLESRIDAIRESDLSYQEKIKAFIRLKIDQTAPMSWDFVKELQSARNLEWLNAMMVWNDKILRLFLDHLKKGQDSGEIRTNVSPETLLYAIDRMIEWENDERFAGRFVTVEALANEILNFVFFGFLGASEGKQP
jgi:AcrR family transcriptional regulator